MKPKRCRTIFVVEALDPMLLTWQTMPGAFYDTNAAAKAKCSQSSFQTRIVRLSHPADKE